MKWVAQACCGVSTLEIFKTQLDANQHNLLVAAPAFCRALDLDDLCRGLLTLVILIFLFFGGGSVKMVPAIRWNIRCSASKIGNKFFKQKWYFAL